MDQVVAGVNWSDAPILLAPAGMYALLWMSVQCAEWYAKHGKS